MSCSKYPETSSARMTENETEKPEMANSRNEQATHLISQIERGLVGRNRQLLFFPLGLLFHGEKFGRIFRFPSLVSTRGFNKSFFHVIITCFVDFGIFDKWKNGKSMTRASLELATFCSNVVVV